MPTSTERVAAALLTVGAFAVMLVFFRGNQFDDVDGYALPKELVVHVSAWGAALLCWGSVRSVRLAGVDRLWIAFFALSAISAAGAVDRSAALRALALSGSTLLLYGAARFLAGRGRSLQLVRAIAGATVLVALLVLGEAVGWVPNLSLLHRVPSGGQGNRNYAAHLMALGLPLLAGLGGERSRLGRVLAPLGIALLAAGLVVTRCRAAWLASLVALLVIVVVVGWWGRAPRRVLRLAGACLVGILMAVGAPTIWKSPTVYLTTMREMTAYDRGSGRGRLIQYRNTLRMSGDHLLFGVGPGNWAAHYPRYAVVGDPSFRPDQLWQTPAHPTGDWLGLFAERGLFCLLAWTMAFVAYARRAWRRARDGEAALLSLLVTIAILGTFDSVVQLPAPALVLFGALGALVPDEATTGGHVVSPRARRGWGAVGVAFALAVVASSAQKVYGSHLYSSARGLADWERAVAVDPHNVRGQSHLAQRYRLDGRCDQARAHAVAALLIQPELRAAQRELALCAAREPKKIQ
jgi:hypothetical protein